jgi:hypothetical protein
MGTKFGCLTSNRSIVRVRTSERGSVAIGDCAACGSFVFGSVESETSEARSEFNDVVDFETSEARSKFVNFVANGDSFRFANS